MCCTCKPFARGGPLSFPTAGGGYDRRGCPIHGDIIEACPICGRLGPCGTDADGRPMVHTDVFPEVS